MLRFLLVVTLAVMASARPQDDGAIPEPLKKLGTLCHPTDVTVAPTDCLCSGGARFPTQIEDLVACNPTKCRCPGKDWEPLKIFGCKNGGKPR